MFDVGSNRAEPNPYAEACISWYAEQQQVFQVFVEIPCPCSKWQAYFDPRFFYQSDSDCAISKYPTSGFYQVSFIIRFLLQIKVTLLGSYYPFKAVCDRNPVIFYSRCAFKRTLYVLAALDL